MERWSIGCFDGGLRGTRGDAELEGDEDGPVPAGTGEGRGAAGDDDLAWSAWLSEVLSPRCARLLGWPVALRVAITVALVALVAGLDITTGTEVSVSAFYLLPVLFAGALLSRSAGHFTAVVCAVLWGFMESRFGRSYSSAWIPWWNSAVRLVFFLLINELVSRQRLAHGRQRALARTDPLTGIANVRVFKEHLGRAIAHARRHGRRFTLTYLDLDEFKRVNDACGHEEGDRVLQAVAATIARHVRVTDVVARLGGDEFGILMLGTDEEQARRSLERVAACLAEEVEARWGVGATFGSVTFTQWPEDADAALRQADALMYEGKAAGRGLLLQATWPARSREDG